MLSFPYPMLDIFLPFHVDMPPQRRKSNANDPFSPALAT